MHASCHATDKELVAGGEKYESRHGCLVGVPDIMACSSGCTFSRRALMLLVVEWYASHFCRLLTKIQYFQMGLFRLLGVQTTLSAAELGSELSAIMFFSLPSASATVFVASHSQQ